MMKNKPLILAALTIILLAYFVIAAAGDGVKILSPSSGNGYSSRVGILYNVSYTNVTDILSPQNATFFLNISGTWTAVANASCNSNNSCAATVLNTTIPDGVYSINATIRNSTATISVNSSSNLSTIVYFDGTPPQVFNENISNPRSWGNYSQSLTLSVSVIDATIGVNTVFFNITNSTGQQNATAVASNSGGVYSATINASHFPEGFYNITVYANDSVNNLNNSARAYQVLFDNTVPVATFTCDDYTVDEDDVMDCNCVYSDALSGIASASFDSSPSTSNSGNNQQSSCTVTDRAGNVNVSTISYNVTGISGGSSSGSSGSSSSGSSSGSSSSGSSSSSNNTSENTTQNQSSGSANLLEGNQEDQTEKEFKLNYWIIGAVILVAGLGIAITVLIKKGILQRLLKFNK